MGTSCSTLSASPENDCGAEHSDNNGNSALVASSSTTTAAYSSNYETKAATVPCNNCTKEDLERLVSSLDAVTEIPSSDLHPLQHAQSDIAAADNDGRSSPPRLPHFVSIAALASELASVEESSNSSQLRLDESGSFRGGAAAAAAASGSAPARSTPRQVSFTFAMRFDEYEEGLPPRECSLRSSDGQRVATPLLSPATLVPLTAADAKHRVQQAVPKSTSTFSSRTTVARSHRCTSPVSPKRETHELRLSLS